MHRAELGVCEAQTAVVRAQAHVLARAQVRAVVERRLQAPRPGRDPGERQRVRERVRGVGDVRLDALRERVEAGVRGDVGGHRQRELGVDDGDVREHVRVAHGDFPVSSLKDAVLRDLRAGARGRGHGDEGRAALGERLGAADDLEEVVQVRVGSAVCQHRGDALARVHRGAAADGDDGAAPVLRGERDGGLRGRGRGLAAGAVVHDRGDAGGFERGDEGRAEAVGRARDDDRGLVRAPLQLAELLDQGGDAGDRAAPEHDARRGRELERRDRGHRGGRRGRRRGGDDRTIGRAATRRRARGGGRGSAATGDGAANGTRRERRGHPTGASDGRACTGTSGRSRVWSEGEAEGRLYPQIDVSARDDRRSGG